MCLRTGWWSLWHSIRSFISSRLRFSRNVSHQQGHKIKLYSQSLELRAIRTISAASSTVTEGTLAVNDVSRAAAYTFSAVDETFFHYPPCKAAYERIRSISKKRGKIVSYNDLLEDPALDEEFRDVLREAKRISARTEDAAKELVTGLDKYRKTRELFFMAKNVLEKLKETKVDVDLLLDEVTNAVTKTRSRENVGEIILSVGKDATGLDLIDEALSTEDDVMLKTGFKDFDEINGGLPAEGVLLLAATTSGGKSAVRMNLMKNMYLLNKVSCLTVSLEMNAKKETRRLLSSLTGIQYWKYTKQKLDAAERKASRRAWKKFHTHGVENECNYALICPTRGLTITSLLMLVKPYGYKVIAIDYISLLEGLSDDRQWQVLSEITRECKVFSAENHCLVILLAQLDSDDDRVRYSKGITENVDSALIWNYSKQEQRDLGILPVKQLKARDGQLFPFDLVERFDIMTVFNPGDKMPEKGPQAGPSTESVSPNEDDPLGEQPIDYGDAAVD